jgi:hypothetical protein
VDDHGQAVAQDEESDEVEAYKAYAMFEIEEAGLANVAESVDIDPNFEYGIGLEAYLNVVGINEAVIARFISDFNAGNLELDPVKYAFESDSDEEDD